MTENNNMDDCGLTFGELDSIVRTWGAQPLTRQLVSIIVSNADRLRAQSVPSDVMRPFAAPASQLALNTMHPDSHFAAVAFWKYWNENGETHKRGYYESTWGAINCAIRIVGVVQHPAASESAVRDALALAIRQNSHDMLMTGEEIRICEAALKSTAAPTESKEK